MASHIFYCFTEFLLTAYYGHLCGASHLKWLMICFRKIPTCFVCLFSTKVLQLYLTLWCISVRYIFFLFQSFKCPLPNQHLAILTSNFFFLCVIIIWNQLQFHDVHFFVFSWNLDIYIILGIWMVIILNYSNKKNYTCFNLYLLGLNTMTHTHIYIKHLCL